VYATQAEKIRAYRLRTRLAALAPDAICRTFGSCTLYCCDWKDVARLLPRQAAIVTDPPYAAGYDVTKTRRRPSQWEQNFVGYDQPFDPTPWLGFPEVVLFGANHYWDSLPAGGSWLCWDKTPGQAPSDFASCEWVWLSKAGPPLYFPHLYRGGMRKGEENWVHLPQKRHPAQKPIDLLTFLVEQTTAPVVIDPFIGSGVTPVACVRLGRPCIGIELEERYFQGACQWVEDELRQRRLFAS
jgi:site-specific DNA-methyltransferase (adenine-specific)/modification methylase